MAYKFTGLNAGDAVVTSGNYVFKKLSGNNGTDGLAYALSDDGTHYTCTGIGTATDTDIVIANSVYGIPVTNIGDTAFRYSSKITSVTIPKNVSTIGEQAFVGCSKLTDIIVDSNNETYKSVDGNLYSNDETTLIRYSIAKTAESFSIPTGVTEISNHAFYQSKLTGISIPEGVTAIGKWAFGNSSLAAITIPESVTSIGYSAFFYCPLTEISVAENNKAYKSINGVLYATADNILWAYPFSKTDTEFTIPYGVTAIGIGAFGGSNVKDISIPNTVTSIGADAFYWGALTSINIPEGVTSIGAGAFQACFNLATVIIPGSVTEILNSAFYACPGLTDVYYCGTEAEWAEISIGANNDELTGATIHYNYTQSITIDGVTYYTDAGMSWTDWVASDYNTAGYYIYTTMLPYTVKSAAGYNVLDSDGAVTPDDIVTVNGVYTLNK